jgi:hypothetical protein
MKNGFSSVIIIAIITAVLVLSAGVYLAPKLMGPPKNLAVETTGKNSPTPTPITSDSEVNDQVSADAFNYDNPKYNLSLSYPSNFGYGVIDPNTTPYFPIPQLALSFSPKFNPGEESQITWKTNSLSFEDPMLFIFSSKDKTLDQYIADYKKHLSEEGVPPKILSEKDTEVAGIKAHQIVTTTTDDSLGTTTTVIVLKGGNVYEFVYYPKHRPNAALSILNSIRL